MLSKCKNMTDTPFKWHLKEVLPFFSLVQMSEQKIVKLTCLRTKHKIPDQNKIKD